MWCKNQYSSYMAQIISCWRPKDHIEAAMVGEQGKAAVRNGGWREQGVTRTGTRETPKTTLLTTASEQMWHLGLGSGLQLRGTWRGHPPCPARSPQWEVRWWVLVFSVQGYLWHLELAAGHPAFATLPLTNHTASATLEPQKRKIFAGQTQHLVLFIKG